MGKYRENQYDMDMLGDEPFESAAFDLEDDEFIDEDELFLARDEDAQDTERYRDTEDHYGKGPKGWRRSDQRIQDEVYRALTSSFDVDASVIVVDVEEGLVTLSGRVQTQEEKRLAEDCADNVMGVKDVQNKLHIPVG